ncbi:MAG: hypothetical protein AAFR79_20445 [Pseudomonadota bacterium]
MKTFITATLAVLIAVPALADGRGPNGAPSTAYIQPSLNGQLDLGHEVTLSPAAINSNINVDPNGGGQTTVEVTDQVDQVTGEVMATATNMMTQINNGSVRASVRSNRHNRAADVSAAAIANTLSIANGISQ